MQTVFSNSMVAHVWAQQSQQSGRSNNGQFYFEGAYLYSYGRHYVAGLFAAPGGPVFINTSDYSVTTGRHLSYAWRAVNHSNAHGVPDLTRIADSLRAAGTGRESEADRARLLRYLSENWQSFGADSEAAAWIYRKAGKRGPWAAFRGRLERAKAKADRENAERTRKAAIREGRELAAAPWPVVRDKAARFADSYGQQELRDYIGDFRAARLATPKAHKRVRATLWKRETALRAMLARAERSGTGYSGRNPGPRIKARAEIAAFRQVIAGRITGVPGYDGPQGPGRLLAALELKNGAGLRLLSNRITGILAPDCIPLPPAMRERLETLNAWADALATEREGEETQRQHVREARRAIRRELRSFNAGRRHFWALVRQAETQPVPDPVTGGWYAAPDARHISRAAESILRPPFGMETPWGAQRGLAIDPVLRERWTRMQGLAAELVAAIETAADKYRTQAEREEAARREAERQEAARVAAMTAEERREAWQAGQLETRHVRSLETVSGPLLRSLDAAIDGCTVTGGTLETSQGATVPLRHAFRVFQFVALCRAERKAWTPGGPWGPKAIRVGHFTLDRIDSSGDFKAGCHCIKWPEVAALAVRLGVADCLATLPEVTAELEGERA